MGDIKIKECGDGTFAITKYIDKNAKILFNIKRNRYKKNKNVYFTILEKELYINNEENKETKAEYITKDKKYTIDEKNIVIYNTKTGKKFLIQMKFQINLL